MRIFASLLVFVCACGSGGGATPDASTSDATISMPRVLDIAPADGADDVPIASVVVVQFSHVMDQDSVTVTLEPAVTTTAEWNEHGDTITLFPAAQMSRDTPYAITVDGETSDGQALTGTLTFGFTTVPVLDATAPEITDFAPVDEAPCDADISIAFSEPMDPRTMYVAALPGHRLGPATWSPGLRRVTFAETPTWPTGSVVDIDVSGTDLAGNQVTARVTVLTCPLPVVAPAVASTYPSPGETGVAPGTHFRVTFSEPMEEGPTGSAVSIYPALTCFGYFENRNRTVTCNEGVAANTTYTVTVYGADNTTWGSYATSEAGVLLPLTYTYSFTTGPAILDWTPPQSTGISPPDGARDVPIGTALIVSFDEEMDPTKGTLNIPTSYAIETSWNEPPTQVTYRFANDWAYGDDIPYTLSGFRDKSGNLTLDIEGTFSTPGRDVGTATSDATRDGTVERPGIVRVDDDQIVVGVTGAASAQKNSRGLISFALPATLLARTGLWIDRAYLVLEQASASLTPLDAHNPMRLSSVSIGDALDDADYDAVTLLGNVDAVDGFDADTVGLHILDVTSDVQYDLTYRAQRDDRSEFRLAFEHELDGTITAGTVGIASGESLTPPQLWIDYTYSR